MRDIRVRSIRTVTFNNARTSRFSYFLGNARVSHTNFVAGRINEHANAPSPIGEKPKTKSTATFRRSRDNNGLDNSRHQPRRTAPGNEVARVRAHSPRPELLESDRLGGEAADRSSDVAAVARVSPRTR